jgi:Uma2 family endonuclease
MHIARAVWIEPSQDFLAVRHREGLDRWDEMWEGVLHMVPPPSYVHNRRQDRLLRFFSDVLEARNLGVVVSGTGVRRPGSGITDYRVPDLSVVSRERLDLIADWIEGGPDLVVEVRSPGDETYEKLPFFADLGVHEVLVIDRDAGRPELYRLAGDGYLATSPDAEGWIASDRFPVAFRHAVGRLEAQDRGAPDRPVRPIEP